MLYFLKYKAFVHYNVFGYVMDIVSINVTGSKQEIMIAIFVYCTSCTLASSPLKNRFSLTAYSGHLTVIQVSFRMFALKTGPGASERLSSVLTT